MLKLIRLPLVGLWVSVSALIGTLVCLIRPFSPKNILFTASLIKMGEYILGMKIVIRNHDKMNDFRPCVFLSNHQDNLDIFAGSKALPPRTVTIGKKAILYIPFFGIFYWLSGNILINRKNKRSAFGTMDEAAKKIQETGLSVWIMPEGTRSRGRGLLPFKKGPFITAIKAGVPIVPVVWNNYIQHLDLNKWHAGTIVLEVLEPIQTTGLTIDDAANLKDKTHAIFAEAVARLDREVAEGRV